MKMREAKSFSTKLYLSILYLRCGYLKVNYKEGDMVVIFQFSI